MWVISEHFINRVDGKMSGQKGGDAKNKAIRYSYQKINRKKYVAISVIVIILIGLFYLSKMPVTADVVGQIISKVSTSQQPLLRFSSVEFAYYTSANDLGLGDRIPPDMVYCHNTLASLAGSENGMGVAKISIKNVGDKPIALSTSTLHKVNEIELTLYSDVKKTLSGEISSFTAPFEHTCSEDGVIRFISSRQAGNTDPIILNRGEEFRFLGVMGVGEKNAFCGKSYPINMAATVKNDRQVVEAFELDSRILTVKC